METILGVTKDTSVNPHRGVAELGENASEADSMFEAEGNNSARERYQRLFWEPAVDGKELILPGLLEQEHAAREAAAAKRAIRFATFEEHVVDVPGRPSVKFVNVGQKYVDEHDQAWRLKERQRRSVLRQHKRQRKAAAALARKEQFVH
ncbi:hypothetical protein SCP_0104250 [Sparassis crispa]|uniref:Uncharacterized protein n=1 Tax=Sparassis crispa TaxID=139825 RepID=A0A401G5V7_9APHY|nr:hypothetical protein SCP_0104250 [Sparassis crispa]GBE77548.1 hypothetical protein SCP_0104250 [Sparassis crispa]